MTGSKPLTPDEKVYAFRRATSGFEKRFAEQIQRGMSDEELSNALKESFGIFGGSAGPGIPHVCYQGAALKIWMDCRQGGIATAQLVCQGTATLNMAREVYSIPDPADAQMSLL